MMLDEKEVRSKLYELICADRLVFIAVQDGGKEVSKRQEIFEEIVAMICPKRTYRVLVEATCHIYVDVEGTSKEDAWQQVSARIASEGIPDELFDQDGRYEDIEAIDAFEKE